LALQAVAIAVVHATPSVPAQNGVPHLAALWCAPPPRLPLKSVTIGPWILTVPDGFIPRTCREEPASLLQVGDPQSSVSFGLIAECQGDGSLRFAVVPKLPALTPSRVRLTHPRSSSLVEFDSYGSEVVWLRGKVSEFFLQDWSAEPELRIELSDARTITKGFVLMEGFNKAVALLHKECPQPPFDQERPYRVLPSAPSSG
jgi:hypothetical protein